MLKILTVNNTTVKLGKSDVPVPYEWVEVANLVQYLSKNFIGSYLVVIWFPMVTEVIVNENKCQR